MKTRLKILFCVEFYYPSVGGAQEVMRQIASRLAARGHEVCVATSFHPLRQSEFHEGVRIVPFRAGGNQALGMHGEIDSYRRFVLEGGFDLVFIYAAQQWTFDALWPILEQLAAAKVLAPCGYSGLSNPLYSDYFSRLPEVLRHFDALVYHASSYRDLAFAQCHGIGREVLIPNAADIGEFEAAANDNLRARLGVQDDTLLLLTVGTINGLKGHAEVLKAFELLQARDHKLLLVLNGNRLSASLSLSERLQYHWRMLRAQGFRKLLDRVTSRLQRKPGKASAPFNLEAEVARINHGHGPNKRAMVVDLPRKELVQAYLQSDLFVFASHVEYSPLVLFECCAAGLPWLTVPVGNAAEIAQWTQAGVICPAAQDTNGYTVVAPEQLALRMDALLDQPEQRQALSARGRQASRDRYNWDSISLEYESLFLRCCNGESEMAKA